MLGAHVELGAKLWAVRRLPQVQKGYDVVFLNRRAPQQNGAYLVVAQDKDDKTVGQGRLIIGSSLGGVKISCRRPPPSGTWSFGHTPTSLTPIEHWFRPSSPGLHRCVHSRPHHIYAVRAAKGQYLGTEAFPQHSFRQESSCHMHKRPQCVPRHLIRCRGHLH